jgi:hypothetical protein
MKTCAVCDERLQGKRRDAVYCSAACKQFAHRRRKAVGEPTVREAQIRVPIPAVVTISEAWKSREQREQPEGPPPTPLVA